VQLGAPIVRSVENEITHAFLRAVLLVDA
jgi:hypothetical protein